jgi:predicted homoserine dehydrogenase-like protein
VTNNLLLRQLASRAESRNPLRVGVIGAGKFGTMFLAQANRITGLHILGIADLDVQRITDSLERAEWHQNSYSASNFEQAMATHTTHITDDPISLIEAEGLEVLVEGTGSPVASTSTHCAP